MVQIISFFREIFTVTLLHGKPHPSQKIIPIYDGDVIDIGERKLLAIALPGHTPGSTALLDENSGMLFSGDPIQDGGIFMFGPMRDMSAYIHSLKRLEKGELVPTERDMFGQTVKAYDVGVATFLCE